MYTCITKLQMKTRLREPPGIQSFELVQVYGGPDPTSPRLTQLCSRRADNVTVSSNGNRMLVRFRSDGSIRGKGFTATYKTRNTGKAQFQFTFPSFSRPG